MAEEGNSYTGFLYAGLMIMADGTPKVIEYNCRFGDPETQPIMLRMQSDLVAHCLAAIDGTLNNQQTSWNQKPSVGVVLAAGGYPNSYNKGDIISGLPSLDNNSASADVSEKVFHAGTTEINGNICTNGGRVLCVTALGENVSDAQIQAYKLAAKISWNGMFYRDDIAWRAIEREQKN
jgi:phosphoribosylamine--glycine ligase